MGANSLDITKIKQFPLFSDSEAWFGERVHDDSVVVREAWDGGNVFNKGGVCHKNQVKDVILTGGFLL